MNELFGIPMSTIMIVLIALLALCLLSVAWVAWRQPVIFKLGVRNIPRRRAETILIVVGLMLSTMIIAAALGTGDTIDHSMTAEAYDRLGRVDELVVATDGAAIDLAGIGADAVVLSESLAEDLDAGVGDAVTLYWDGVPFEKSVAAIAEDPILTGGAGLAIPL